MSHNNFTTYYMNIVKSILKNVDPINKKNGRPFKYNNYDIYLKHIMTVLITGISWNQLSNIINISTDIFKKKYIKWSKLRVFEYANNIILKQYKRKNNINALFIDSTNIVNFNGQLDFGYNIKNKNKKSIKITVLVDNNKVPFITEISNGSIHDAKITENIINTHFSKNKNCR